MRSLVITLLILTMVSGPSYAQSVAIPDTAFLYALIDEGVDTNGDSLISIEEAEAVTSLDVHNNISDMTGIEAFVNLDALDCNGEGSSGVLPNFITSLDISNNAELEYLWCGENMFNALDVSNNDALLYLACNQNLLTSLDVSNNPKLEKLRCWNNQLTSLTVLNDTVLTDLICFGNLLTSLDISRSTSLKALNISYMPTLYEVCVWTMPFPPEGVELTVTNSPNICFADTCGSCGVGVNEYRPSGFSLYPNPLKNILTVETNTTGQYSLIITSINGKLLYSNTMEGSTYQIDLSSFQKGLYFITIRSSDYIRTDIIIKQ